MPTASRAGRRPGDDRGVEARVRAELGTGSVPAHLRERHLADLRALAAALRPTDTVAASSWTQQRSPAEGDAASSASERRPATLDRTRGAPGRRAGRRFVPTSLPRAAAAALAACAVLTVGAGSAVAASAPALPGEMLHPVKLTVEQVGVAVSWSDDAAVDAHLEVAAGRLEEAQRLVAGDGDFDELRATLERHAAALAAARERAGGDPALEAAVDDAAGVATARLSELLSRLPETASPQAREALDRALERLAPAASGERDTRRGAPARDDVPGVQWPVPVASRDHGGQPRPREGRSGEIDGETVRAAFVSTGEDFPDSVAAGPGAFASGAPILLTDSDELHPAAEAALDRLDIDHAFVLGGKAAISDDVLAELEERVDTVERLDGANRSETAVAVAERLEGEGFDFDPANIGLATAWDFADALASAPYLGSAQARLLLVDSDAAGELPEAVTDHLEARGCEITFVHILGGQAAVGADVREAALEFASCQAEDTPGEPGEPRNGQPGEDESEQE